MPRFPIVSSQLGIWFADQIASRGNQYVIAHAIEIRGALDPELLRLAIAAGVSEADTVTARYFEDETGIWQDVSKRGAVGSVPLPEFLDLSGSPDPWAAAWDLMKYYGWKDKNGKFSVFTQWAKAAGLAAPYPGFFTDPDVIAAFPTFELGFVELARYAAVSGWGGWELVDLDREAKTAVFRVTNGWESVLARDGSAFNGGLVAGKLTGLCQRLFGTTCWPRQTAFLSEGDPYDEFVIEASTRSLDDELRELAALDQATAAVSVAALAGGPLVVRVHNVTLLAAALSAYNNE